MTLSQVSHNNNKFKKSHHFHAANEQHGHVGIIKRKGDCYGKTPDIRQKSKMIKVRLCNHKAPIQKATSLKNNRALTYIYIKEREINKSKYHAWNFPQGKKASF